MLIRKLTEDDLPAAMRLSKQAGWNQIRADWRRLLDLNPNGCFAGIVDGELVATSTLATFDDVGWIGMVLVDENHRRRGFGMEIFERALETAIESGVAKIGLDATDAGRSVYEKVGFTTVAPIERWGGRPDNLSTGSERYTVVRNPARAEITAIDRRACGLDRGELLDHLATEPDVETLLVEHADTGESRGYAVIRPGRKCAQIGPIVAADDDALAALVGTAAESISGSEIVVDVVGDREAKDVLRDAELECRRRLKRMTYREPVQVLLGDDIVAAAGFELG